MLLKLDICKSENGMLRKNEKHIFKISSNIEIEATKKQLIDEIWRLLVNYVLQPNKIT